MVAKKKKKVKSSTRYEPYRSISHPAVGQVACPHCNQPAGAPCITPGGSSDGRQYVQTHKARVRAASAAKNQPASTTASQEPEQPAQQEPTEVAS
jgi:hypothetical protein